MTLVAVGTALGGYTTRSVASQLHGVDRLDVPTLLGSANRDGNRRSCRGVRTSQPRRPNRADGRFALRMTMQVCVGHYAMLPAALLAATLAAGQEPKQMAVTARPSRCQRRRVVVTYQACRRAEPGCCPSGRLNSRAVLLQWQCPIRIRPEDQIRHIALDICPQVRRSSRGDNHIARNHLPAGSALDLAADVVAARPRGRTRVRNACRQ